MPSFLQQFAPEQVSEITGLPAEDIRTAARWIGEATNWMSIWTMGLNQSTHGTWNTNAICNLHLATGAICKPGSGPFSLTGQPNAMGGREMGYMGPGLPGQRSVTCAEDREFVEDQWGIPRGSLRTDVSDGVIDMFSRMADGQIKACWIICTNPVATVANRKTVLAGLEKAELVITQDAFVENETNEYADVVLPAALWTESDGVMVNSERNLTLFQKAVEPVGQALPDWQIIARIACAMGYSESFSYDSAEDVFDEIKRFWNPKTGYDLRGVSYDRLRQTPLQWPCPPDSATDRNPIRYRNDGVSQTQLVRDDGSVPRLAFPTATGRAMFFARPHLLPEEMPDAAYPFLLNTGRLAHQWHTMTKTGKIAKLNKLNPGPFVEIHPEDAARLDICDGDRVEIASRRGRAVLPAVITDRVRPGNCFAPFHWNDVFGEYLSINAVTSDAVDPISRQPEYKACAISLTKVSSKARTGVGVRSPAGRQPGLPNRRLRPITRGGKRTHTAVWSAGPLLPGGSDHRAAFGSRPAHDRRAHLAAQRPVRFHHPAVGGRSARRAVRARPGPRSKAGGRRTGHRVTRLRSNAPAGADRAVVGLTDRQRRRTRRRRDRPTRRGRAAGRVARHGRFRACRPGENTGATADHQHHRGRRAAGQWRCALAGAVRRESPAARRHPLRGACARRLQLRRLLRARTQTR